MAQAKGIAAPVSETFIKVTAKIKKDNFSDHVKKAKHMQQRFCDIRKLTILIVYWQLLLLHSYGGKEL